MQVISMIFNIARNLQCDSFIRLPLITWAVSLISCSILAAEEVRFGVVGDRLFFNSDVPYEGGLEDDIVYRDVEELGLFLMEYPEIGTLVLNSVGGSRSAAMAMAEKVEKLGLATEIAGQCFSACPLIFLAGRPRTLAKGAIIGFHRSYVTASDAKEFQEDALLAGVSAYEFGATRAAESLMHMVRHGVNPDFALTVLGTPPYEDWIPTRRELIDGNVLDE